MNMSLKAWLETVYNVNNNNPSMNILMLLRSLTTIPLNTVCY